MPAGLLLQQLSSLAPLRHLSLSEESLQEGCRDVLPPGQDKGKGLRQPCGVLLPELLSALALPCELMSPKAGLLQVWPAAAAAAAAGGPCCLCRLLHSAPILWALAALLGWGRCPDMQQPILAA
jgi:hypothetical protein